MNLRNVLAIVAAILLLLLCWTGYKSYSLGSQVTKLEAENKSLTEKVGNLETLKIDLQTQVDSLESQYNVLNEENAALATTVEEEQARVRRRNRTIKKLKAAASTQKSTATDNANLQSQISALLAAKSQLEANINDLQTENAALREKLGIVEASLTQAKDNNAALDALNKTMQSEIANLTLSNFKATAFQVEVEKRRGEKVTSKSRRAKTIKASFDLTNVPQKYQGVRPIYMVISDENSNPIFLDNPIKATVRVNNSDSPIIAAEKKEINIKENQRLSFNHKLAKQLKKGYYRVIVYTDIGVLGASTIRLR
jgi:septal ring factor EnvC (AmiA/AmiB activator)